MFILFPWALVLKMKVISRLEFELAYYTVADQHISHYDMGISPRAKNIFKRILYGLNKRLEDENKTTLDNTINL